MSAGTGRAAAAGTRAQQQGRSSRQVDSSLTQVLVDVNRQRTWAAERTLTTSQDARVRAAEQDLAARVARAYFGVLSALATLATAQANEDAFAAQVAQAQQRFDAGLSAQIDVEQGRTYHALARGTSVQARQALAATRTGLALGTRSNTDLLHAIQTQAAAELAAVNRLLVAPAGAADSTPIQGAS